MSWGKYTSREFSFGKCETPSSVGPGSYQIQDISKVNHISKTSFGNSRDQRNPFGATKSRNPPPGHYDINTEMTSRPFSAPFKSKAERLPYKLTESPAPTEYNHIISWEKCPKKKLRSKKINRDPPPSGNIGQDISGYEVLPNGSIVPIRNMKKSGTELGPGSYDISISDYSHTHILSSGRPKSCLESRSKSPGPGHYTPTDFNTKVPINIHKLPKPKIKEAPKGGELYHDDIVDSSKLYGTRSFKSKTKRELWKKTDDVPCATKYQKEKSHEPSQGKSVFGTRSVRFSQPENDNSPGPGQYESPNSGWSTVRSQSSMSRDFPKDSKNNDTPGPGTYTSSSQWKIKSNKPSPQFAINNNERFPSDSNDTPDPTAYSPKYPDHKIQYTISSRSSRQTLVTNVSGSPSPQEYNIIPTNKIKTRPSSMSKSKRFTSPTRDDTPGPGSYAVDHDHDSLIKISYNSDLSGIKSIIIKE